MGGHVVGPSNPFGRGLGPLGTHQFKGYKRPLSRRGMKGLDTHYHCGRRGRFLWSRWSPTRIKMGTGAPRTGDPVYWKPFHHVGLYHGVRECGRYFGTAGHQPVKNWYRHPLHRGSRAWEVTRLCREMPRWKESELLGILCLKPFSCLRAPECLLSSC